MQVLACLASLLVPNIENFNSPSLSSAESRHSTLLAMEPATSALPTPEQDGRLSMATPTRLLFGSLSSGFVGFTLGAVQGGQMAQLRFRAEHAHKMPDSTTGWYLYHKSKNYHAMQGGIREGLRMAVKTSFWTFLALGLESTVDSCRGASDMFSTVIATLTVAGTFSLGHKLTLSTTARTARLGLVFGLVYGGIQDVVGLARGRPIGYVELIRRRLGSASAVTAFKFFSLLFSFSFARLAYNMRITEADIGEKSRLVPSTCTGHSKSVERSMSRQATGPATFGLYPASSKFSHNKRGATRPRDSRMAFGVPYSDNASRH
ncbi:hypothetical protein L249_5207 [Ophiocordyceps polyrhachis-furcata BCC 54312]|uniref:Uncharacterized protein n=1 Tax=Ophiocordyceps polyrhachis-furcata BCC 54312 TaxID=1330021 RepID=A0A367L9H2_9HYPO|nr:hypothetical protein L249_5207 [Ophiocordyceps polyrhachis-furcata BCC 54312]